jgi:hypothetical protein
VKKLEFRKLIREEIQKVLKEDVPPLSKTLNPGTYMVQDTEDGKYWGDTNIVIRLSLPADEEEVKLAAIKKINPADITSPQFYRLTPYKAPKVKFITINLADISNSRAGVINKLRPS